MNTNYQVIEDNGGGMYIFFFAEDEVILGFTDIEYLGPGGLDEVTYEEATTWEHRLTSPQATYDNITSYEFGWQIVADQDALYPDRMGNAAKTVFNQDDDD